MSSPDQGGLARPSSGKRPQSASRSRPGSATHVSDGAPAIGTSGASGPSTPPPLPIAKHPSSMAETSAKSESKKLDIYEDFEEDDSDDDAVKFSVEHTPRQSQSKPQTPRKSADFSHSQSKRHSPRAGGSARSSVTRDHTGVDTQHTELTRTQLTDVSGGGTPRNSHTHTAVGVESPLHPPPAAAASSTRAHPPTPPTSARATGSTSHVDTSHKAQSGPSSARGEATRTAATSLEFGDASLGASASMKSSSKKETKQRHGGSQGEHATTTTTDFASDSQLLPHSDSHAAASTSVPILVNRPLSAILPPPRRHDKSSDAQKAATRNTAATESAAGALKVFGMKRWRPVDRRATKPPKAHRWAGAAVGNNVFLVGGIVNAAPSAAIFAFNTTTKLWKSLGIGGGAPKPPPVVGHTATPCGKDGKILAVIGGGAPTVFLLSTSSMGWTAVDRKQSLASAAWTADPRDPHDRKGHTAVTYEGDVFVFGGSTKRGKTNLVDRFVHAANAWEPTTTPAMDGRAAGAVISESTGVPALTHHTAVVFDTRMILFGGKDAAGDPCGEVHVYDFTVRRFNTNVATPRVAPAPRYGHGAAALPGRDTMIVFGGCVGASKYSEELWCLDTMSYSWRPFDVAGAIPRAFGLLSLVTATQRRAADDDDDTTEKPTTAAEEDGGMPRFLYFGGGALPPAGASRYAQLAFTASCDVLEVGMMPAAWTIKDDTDEDGDDAATENDLTQAPAREQATVARKRPESAPAARRSRPSSAAPVEYRDRRTKAHWNLTNEFPPPPPVIGRKSAAGSPGGEELPADAPGGSPTAASEVFRRTLCGACARRRPTASASSSAFSTTCSLCTSRTSCARRNKSRKPRGA
jgi:hypothetical protein